MKKILWIDVETTDSDTKRGGGRGNKRNHNNSIGKKFNMLLVKSVISKRDSKNILRYYYNCLCDCGIEKTIDALSLLNNIQQSCGCIKKVSKHLYNKKEYGYSNYENMLSRCYNINNPHYNRYGGRGIKVSDDWLDSFDNFARDMGEKPIGYSIERLNNNLGYSKDNCVWASRFEQAQNTSLTKRFLVDNIFMTRREISQKYKIKHKNVCYLTTTYKNNYEEKIKEYAKKNIMA